MIYVKPEEYLPTHDFIVHTEDGSVLYVDIMGKIADELLIRVITQEEDEC